MIISLIKPLTFIITGLDPALPLFNLAMPGSRISNEDAEYVELFHTNAGILGVINPLGDADFYPSGGAIQIGCNLPISSCSHQRSWQLFAESITTSVGFYGKKCKSQVETILEDCTGDKAEMCGTKDKIGITGSFYVETNKKAPFAKGLPQ